MSTPGLPIPETFNGPLFLGSVTATLLFGIYLVQAHRYSLNAHKDRWHIPALVTAVTIVEATGIAVTLHSVYHVLCFSSVGPTPTFQMPPPSISISVLTVLTSTIVQSFFAWRIYTLGKSQRRVWPRFMAALVELLALTQISCNIVVAVQVASFNSDTKKFADNETPVRTWLITAVICDILMSGTMITLLWRYKQGVRTRSHGLVNQLIRNTVENGAITALCATIQLIVYALFPNILVHVAFAYIGARLYANVLIASLNARKTFRDEIMNQSTNFTVPGASRSDHPSVVGRPGHATPTNTQGRHANNSILDRFRTGLTVGTGTQESRSIQLTTMDTGYDYGYAKNGDDSPVSPTEVTVTHQTVHVVDVEKATL